MRGYGVFFVLVLILLVLSIAEYFGVTITAAFETT